MVVVVDTSIWIDHLRSGDPRLKQLIADKSLFQHPFIIGEISVGNLATREQTVRALRGLPQIEPVSEEEFHRFLGAAELFGTGLGFVDVHVLAATAATPGAEIWTGDRRMLEQAERLGLTYTPA